jgi:hypothetical protein
MAAVQKRKKPVSPDNTEFTGFFNAPDAIRTHDLRFRKCCYIRSCSVLRLFASRIRALFSWLNIAVAVVTGCSGLLSLGQHHGS